eukprot:4946219-Amphidinium_carterae.1
MRNSHANADRLKTDLVANCCNTELSFQMYSCYTYCPNEDQDKINPGNANPGIPSRPRKTPNNKKQSKQNEKNGQICTPGFSASR